MNNEIEQIIEENKDSANEFTTIYCSFNALYQLQQENKKLKEELEEYKNSFKYFKCANKNVTNENQQQKNDINKLQKELNEENLQCSKYAIKINDLKENNKQLKDNWNKLKEYLHNQIPTDKTVLTKYIKIFEVLDKMQELEQGSDNNDSNR